MTVAVVAITAGIKACSKASDKKIAQLKKTAKIESGIYAMRREYLKTTSKGEQEVIKTQIRMYQALGLSLADATKRTMEDLEKSSEGFRKWKASITKDQDDVVKGGRKVSESLKSAMESMTERIKELTLNEYDFRKWKAEDNYKKTYTLLQKEKANHKAFADLKKVRILEIAEIEEEQRQADLEATRALYTDKGRSLSQWIAFAMQKYTEHKEFLDQMKVEKMEADLAGEELERAKLEQWKIDQEAKVIKETENKIMHEEGMLAIDEAYKSKSAEITAKYEDKKIKKFAETFSKYANFAKQGLSILTNLGQAHYNKKKKQLDHWYEQEKTLIEQSTMNEEEKKKALEKLETEYQSRSRAMDAKEAKRQKSMAIVEAIINTATAVAKALPNIPLAILAGAMGLAQIALIKSQPVGMAEGGMTKSDGLAYLHKSEVVMPFDKIQAMFGGEGEGSAGGVHFHFHGVIDATGFERIVDERVIPILEDRFKSENAMVHPNAIKEY